MKKIKNLIEKKDLINTFKKLKIRNFLRKHTLLGKSFFFKKYILSKIFLKKPSKKNFFEKIFLKKVYIKATKNNLAICILRINYFKLLVILSSKY